MGGTYTIFNDTAYNWYYNTENKESSSYHSVAPGNTATFKVGYPLYLRYENHKTTDLRCDYGGYIYTIKERRDSKKFELLCGTKNHTHVCPHFDEQEKSLRQQQRRKQEQREQERREQEQREQQKKEQQRLHQIKREEANYCVTTGHQLHQDNTGENWDELLLVGKKFDEILSEFDVSEGEDIKVQKLEDRMKALKNELMIQYFGGDHLPYSSLLAIDQTIEFEELSLMERLCVVKAMLQLMVDSDDDNGDILSLSLSREHDLLLRLVTYLQQEISDLAVRIFFSFTEFESELTSESRVTLGHILFNNIWTPVEIMLLLQSIMESTKHHSKIAAILETVLCYRLSYSSVLCALRKRDTVYYLRQRAVCEADKDLDTLISEMRKANYPESTIKIIHDVLRYAQEKLSKLSDKTRLHKSEIWKGKQMIRALDFSQPDIGHLQQLLILMSRAVRKVKGYFPRLTQLASLLLLLLPKARGEKGCLLEINTGEGKTCIIAMFAAIKAICGFKPDILTSSPVLAERDQKQWDGFYSIFRLRSAVVPPAMANTNFEELVKKAYREHIVYGTAGTFAADILKQEFEREITRGSRRFDMVIVDEIDYMTLDNGAQITFLSYQHSILRHMEQVLAGIWAMLSACRPIQMFETEEIHWINRSQLLHKTAESISEYHDLSTVLKHGVKLGFYSQDLVDKAEGYVEADDENQDFRDPQWRALEEIMTKMGPDKQYVLLREFEKENDKCDLTEYYSLIDGKAALYGDITDPNSSEDKVRLLLLKEGYACQIIPENELITGIVEQLNLKIKYSDKCDSNDVQKVQEFIVIPSCLKEYTEHHLCIFAENALRAIVMEEGREYLIEKAPEADTKDESEKENHQYDAIIPVDFMASGVLQKNSKWGEGLQQFLEMKHQLAISPMTSVTNYLSNIHYLQRYLSGEGVFGATGTLGGDAEKEFLYRHYETKSYVVPTHRHKRVVELPAVQVTGGKKKWFHKICETAWKAADRELVVLVICEDVRTANELQSEICQTKYEITMYTNSRTHDIETYKFGGGDIIIATNLAGRGTDIQVQPNVNSHGGLFVLLTYFPKSQRVEKQVFGRTARKGNPGKVQMVLNQEQLEPDYQGQSAEVMRKLREEKELNHIQHMEGDELHVINNKDILFSTFCRFLGDFQTKYAAEERRSFDDMKINDVPECFKNFHRKFDYHPAISALKETWALWLSQHEEQIHESDKEINKLIEDLRRELEQRSNSLLQGKSNNFHDHIRQAANRTDLHRWNKSLSYGAEEYWQNAAECDTFYSAVALYNKAYVTINLRQKDYMSIARKLLEKAETLVDVFVFETTNTMSFCYLTVTNGFRSHQVNSNFQMQMQARTNIFKSWKGYIKNALEKLGELQNNRHDAITESSAVYCLLDEKDFITANELRTMYQYGLAIVFEIKQKPRISFDALFCLLIGVSQVVAGALVLALTCGAATNFGLGFISEGVSDIINGINGMIKGTFSWAEWAISKSISIGIALISGGIKFLGKGLKNMGESICKGAKSVVTGAKSATKLTVMQTVRQTATYTLQELGKQGVLSAVNYAMDEGFKAEFTNIFKSAFDEKVSKLIEDNGQLDKALNHFICQVVPKKVPELADFKIDPQHEKALCREVTHMTTVVIPGLLTDLTKVHQVINILSKVSSSALGALKQHKASELISVVLSIAEYDLKIVQMLKAIPTEAIINDQFVPQFLTKMICYQQENYIKNERQAKIHRNDERWEITDVKRLKNKFKSEIAKTVSEAFVSAFVAHLTSITTRATGSLVNQRISECTGNLLGRHETQAFFDDQKHGHKMRMAREAPVKSLSKSQEAELLQYVEEVIHENPATGLDLHVLTKSDLLEGKGIRVIIVDEKSNPLYEEHYKGKDKSAGHITLRLVKQKDTSEQKKGILASFSRRIHGETQPYSGHFEVLNADGTFSPVHSEGQNCLYHAVCQANSHGQRDIGDLRREALKLRKEVHLEIQQKPSSYASLLSRQRRYEESYRKPGLFTISGGNRLTKKESLDNFLDVINTAHYIHEEQRQKYERDHLGMVGPHGDLKGKPGREADHTIPKSCIKEVSDYLKENPQKSEELKRKNPKLLEELNKSPHFSLCITVQKEHHRQVLTTGSSTEAKKCRSKITEALLQGDMETTLKLAFITSHPLSSYRLREDAGKPPNKKPTDTDYYKVGFKLIIDQYHAKGIISSAVKNNLNSWVRNQGFLNPNTSVYKSLKAAISS